MKDINIMNSLLLICETFSNGYRDKVLDILSLICVLSGIFVIISKNPIVSVLYLISLFLSIACYLLVLGINFIGLSYLLVYVGAVSILFLFILMLINVRVSELSNDTSNSIPLALVITVAFNFPVSQILPLNLLSFNSNNVNTSYFYLLGRFFSFLSNNDEIMFVTSKL